VKHEAVEELPGAVKGGLGGATKSGIIREPLEMPPIDIEGDTSMMQEMKVIDPVSYNEELMSITIPRNSEELYANKDKVLEKVKLQAPQFYDLFRIALDHKNEKHLHKTMTTMSNSIPHLFEPDEYNAFDGKILDPQSVARAAESIRQRTDLTNSIKFAAIDHLTRNKEVLV